jgi:hypothetical protein
MGWSISYFYGGINGAPPDGNGSIGMLTRDSQGNSAGGYFSAGASRLAPQVYTYVVSPTAGTASPGGGGPAQWFGTQNITGALDGISRDLTPGFVGASQTTSLSFPVAVNQVSGISLVPSGCEPGQWVQVHQRSGAAVSHY